MGAFSPFFFFLLFLFSSVSTLTAHNITEILSTYPEYSLYNSYLLQTKLADEINSRQTLTCLVLNNGVMQSLVAKHPLSTIKNALSLLTVLDYYDGQKLHDISNGTTLTTTLYQTTGKATGNLGFVNITDLKGGKVGFGSAAPGSKLDATYTKSVKQIPYNISVLEISAPIIAPGLLSAPAPTAAGNNITGLLEKAGCKIFASLIVDSGVLKLYENSIDKGLTIFAPTDMAFKADGVPDVTKLSSADLVALLQYHAINGYNPKTSLKTRKEPISTLASSGAGKFQLNVTSSGDDVRLLTGVDSSRVAETVLDDTPLCILTVDNILLPSELFSPSPAPAPAPEPVKSPSPSPASVPIPAPALSPEVLASPPAPPVSPELAPAGAPTTPSDSSKSISAAVEKALLNLPVITVTSAVLIVGVLVL